ncbi:MAG TPA: DNA polymerase III subunit gamma/tau [Buchnera sp. (in: enterobacteria)]|nr:DNA polymerase III subunit gamma/tau [Buchnera sp. (in: enterobacteria)]
MTYQIFARKYRPQSFNEIAGQKSILTAISNSLLLGNIHHAWIFSGPRGIGKTTISRLLAKCLNCKQGITSIPCRKCSNCQDIEQGHFIDLLEVDAASKTKIEDIKELLENIQYLPIKGRFTVYLIDEIHMLSRHSFNSLLKILEEPPKHVKFILATTNTDKVPKTILSRCLQFKLKKLNSIDIYIKLKNILDQEHITYDLQSLQMISQKSDGSLRDALNLTEQAIAIGKGSINFKNIIEIFGTIDSSQSLLLIIAMLKKDANQIIQLLNQLDKIGIHAEEILIDMLKYLHHIAMIQKHSLSFNNSEYSISENKLLSLIAKSINHSDIQLYYQTLIIGRKELSLAPNYKIGIEMILLRTLNLNIKAFEKII